MSDDTNIAVPPEQPAAPAELSTPAPAPSPARRAYLPWWGWTLIAACLVIALLAGVRIGAGVGGRASYAAFRRGGGITQAAPGWHGRVPGFSR